MAEWVIEIHKKMVGLNPFFYFSVSYLMVLMLG
jgi:hypothetical protein